MRQVIAIMLLLTCTLAACIRNEIIPGTSSGPAYRASGSLDGNEFSFETGVDGMELIPTFDRSEYGVYSCVGKFRSTNIGGPKLTIYFNNVEQSWAEDSLDLSNVLTPSSKLFQTQPNLEHNIIELKSFSDPNLDFLWVLNGETMPMSSSEIFEYTVTPGGGLEIGLTVSDGIDCSNHLDLLIDQQFSVDVPIDHQFFTWSFTNANEIVCIYEGDYSEVANMQWVITGPEIEHFVSEDIDFTQLLGESGVYEVSMQVTLFNGNQFKHTENIASPDLTNQCAANLMFRTKIQEPVTNDFGDVKVEYTDLNDVLYSSVLADNSVYSFEILDVLGEINNARGFKSKVLKVLFSCQLANVNDPSDIILMENVEGVLAVSFPQ